MPESSEDEVPPRMPAGIRELGEKAVGRHLRRPATPPLKVTLEGGRWWFGSPYAAEDEDNWVALLFDAFATRSQATFRTFMCQLAELCSTEFNDAENAWHPSEDELIAAVQIVRSTKPRNEAEACLAAQMVAVHVMQTKLSAQAIKSGWPDPRTCAIAGKLARTYAMQLQTLAKLKGRGSRQRITVRKYSQHEHKHVHLHQGSAEIGSQPHEPRGRRTSEISATGKLTNSATLPSPHTEGHALHVPGHQRKEEMPDSRGCEEIRRSEGPE